MGSKKIEPKNPDTTDADTDTDTSADEKRDADRKTQAFRSNGRKSARKTGKTMRSDAGTKHAVTRLG